MEHKGGRIKDHIKREETQEKEDWLDVEWLDDEEDTPGRGDAMQTPSGSDEEPFEIEDWRDEENWNLDRKEESPKEEPAQNADQKRPGTVPEQEHPEADRQRAARHARVVRVRVRRERSGRSRDRAAEKMAESRRESRLSPSRQGSVPKTAGNRSKRIRTDKSRGGPDLRPVR